MEAKKISFGFSKITKKLNLLPSKESTKDESKIELIKCLEGQEIKLVEEKPDVQPLVIPLKESHKTSAALASLMKRRAVLLGEEEPEDITEANQEPTTSTNNGEPEDIEKRAARELLAEIGKNDVANPANNLVLPVVKPEDLPLEGAKESSLDDYDSIPIQDFGKAMLRGMGWSEPPPKNCKKGGPPVDDTPMVRPKGMGLGADKALNKKPLLVAPEANEILEVKRNAYVRILGGKHKDLYGQIEGFDDHAGRVVVKMAIGGAKEAFNEFLCQPVSRKEYAQYGKCINSTKYDEYKKKENELGQIILDNDEKNQLDKNYKDKRKIKDEIIKSEAEDYKYKNKGDYKYEDFDKEKRDIKKENGSYEDRSKNGNDRDKDKDRRRDYDKYNEKSRDKSEDRDRRRETYKDEERNYKKESHKDDRTDSRREYNKNDERGQRKEYSRSRDEDYGRDVDRSRRRDEDKFEKKSNRKIENVEENRYRSSRNDDRDSNRDRKRSPSLRNNPEYDRSSNKYREDRQRERDRDQHKVIELNDSSDSESKAHSSKHKKSKKSKHSKKKSKKSKKSKSKNSDTSDSESSSTDSSSDSEDERKKKHKKKTKKSKKERERSRSRGRR